MAYIIALVLGVIFRYQLQQTQACLYWGKKISSPEFLAISLTGMQDAITPPSWTNLSISMYLSMVILIGVAGYFNGWISGVVVVASVIILTTVVAGVTFIPKASSQHFLTQIMNSLANRSADYSKKGDHERALASKTLFKKLSETAYGRPYDKEISQQ